MDLHVHEMKHWKSIPDYCSWVWIPIQGHLWRHSEADNPITFRSQSDLQSDHSPIICFTTISHYSPEKN